MTRFAALEVEGWRQFGSVQIEFHPRATIITGANGTGKTTLLSILSQHFGWTPLFIGTLRIDRQGALKYYSGVTSDVAEGNANVGKLTYDDGSLAVLQAPTEGAAFQVRIHGQQAVPASTSRRIAQCTVIRRLPKFPRRFRQVINCLTSTWTIFANTTNPGPRFSPPATD